MKLQCGLDPVSFFRGYPRAPAYSLDSLSLLLNGRSPLLCHKFSSTLFFKSVWAWCICCARNTSLKSFGAQRISCMVLSESRPSVWHRWHCTQPLPQTYLLTFGCWRPFSVGQWMRSGMFLCLILIVLVLIYVECSTLGEEGGVQPSHPRCSGFLRFPSRLSCH